MFERFLEVKSVANQKRSTQRQRSYVVQLARVLVQDSDARIAVTKYISPSPKEPNHTFQSPSRKEHPTCRPCSFSSSWWLWWCALSPSGLTMVATTLAIPATSLLIPMPTTTTEPTTQPSATCGRNKQLNLR
ncbi:hypothetical protein AVEN_135020-1 [Araneus ventricosus]|uniref:Uncharacterized protein n=1 Tax=Araneus ventricosus TaxID=182803 RepID=A0A4Y2G484_ARAVE|nr:hypothetical protein AVEN_135020-1 [Araneus ventricosus]